MNSFIQLYFNMKIFFKFNNKDFNGNKNFGMQRACNRVLFDNQFKQPLQLI